MAFFRHRHADNVRGKYYIDILCLDCTFCRDTVPGIFARDDAHNATYVARQPEAEEEIERCEMCLSRCPCEAIGNDGDLHDWEVETRDLDVPAPLTSGAGVGRRKKPGWKFW